MPKTAFTTTAGSEIEMTDKIEMSDDESGAEKTSSDKDQLPNRQTPYSQAFKDFIPTGWVPFDSVDASSVTALPAAAHTAARRDRIAELFADERLVVPAGTLSVRSNDTDFRFRPHSAFAWLTGLGTDREPDAVLVLEPSVGGHQPTLYFRPRAPREAEEFYADARYGEMWVGQRESLAEMSAATGLPTAPIDELPAALEKNADTVSIRILRDADADITAQVDAIRADAQVEPTQDHDQEFQIALSELRLIKDAFEIQEMRTAATLTAQGFAAVVADLPEAVRRGRGERWVEGIFGLHARHVGNDVGYGTIAAAGDHACTLHWVRNDGDVREGDLLLIDAGVELDSLYTADVTRTLPISGRFSAAQRKVYDAVLAAQTAGIAAAIPGAKFSDVHRAAITVIADRLAQWGLLPVSAEESLDPDTGGHHRRWMVHGTSHHLGIDVHDCAQARNENYREGTLQPGMIITVEPGIYFREADLLVPDELRGIGIRIEDDILITDQGNENLSAALPRSADDVESWMASLMSR